MNIPSDPPSLGDGGVHGALEQRLALRAGSPDPPSHRGGERKLDQLEHHEREDQRRCKGQPEIPSTRGHRPEALIGLEQQRLARRCFHGQVDLEQLSEPAVEAILRPREVADVRLDAAVAKRGELIGAEVVVLADQAPFVRVGQPARGLPQLHPDDRVLEDALSDQLVEARQRAAGARARPPR